MCLLFVVIGAGATIDELIGRANQLNLAADPAWLNLIHMRSPLAGSDQSEVVDQ